MGEPGLTVMPAVDSPDPGGLTVAEPRELLAAPAPAACGAEVTVFDPDLDPAGEYAAQLTEVLVTGLGQPGPRARETPA